MWRERGKMHQASRHAQTAALLRTRVCPSLGGLSLLSNGLVFPRSDSRSGRHSPRSRCAREPRISSACAPRLRATTPRLTLPHTRMGSWTTLRDEPCRLDMALETNRQAGKHGNPDASGLKSKHARNGSLFTTGPLCPLVSRPQWFRRHGRDR